MRLVISEDEMVGTAPDGSIYLKTNGVWHKQTSAPIDLENFRQKSEQPVDDTREDATVLS